MKFHSLNNSSICILYHQTKPPEIFHSFLELQNSAENQYFESFSVQIQLNEVLTQKYFDFLPGVLFTLF